MNKSRGLTALALLTASVLLASCARVIAVEPTVLAQEEGACYHFVQTHMLVGGGMITNYHQKPHNEELATGREVLSESQGLLLQYAADIGDRAVFDQVYGFTTEHLDNGKVFVYRYDPDADEGEAFNANAAVDDLRIIKALFTGGEVFSDRALTRAGRKYAGRFYQSNVENGRLYDFYDTELFMKNNFITLCYLDLEALDMLAVEDPRYGQVYDSSLATLEGGYISDDFPMFMARYDYGTNRYEAPAGINMIESVLTALNLARAGKCPETTVAFLKERLEQGRVYAGYKVDGTVKDEFESTAVYALCALLAQEIGDEAMYHKSISLMQRFMVTRTGDALHGAFGDSQNVYSFDNLMALTALRKGANP